MKKAPLCGKPLRARAAHSESCPDLTQSWLLAAAAAAAGHPRKRPAPGSAGAAGAAGAALAYRKSPKLCVRRLVACEEGDCRDCNGNTSSSSSTRGAAGGSHTRRLGCAERSNSAEGRPESPSSWPATPGDSPPRGGSISPQRTGSGSSTGPLDGCCGYHPQYSCTEFDPDADRSGDGVLLPPVHELKPGQPWGLPPCQRLRTHSNGFIWESLLALPERVPPALHPDAVLHGILRERGYSTQMVPTLESEFRRQPTVCEVACYDKDLITAVREDDVDALRALRNAGRCMSACNRFGESILHTAARRGSARALAFLLACGVSPGAADDYGRTPLHDALWTPEPRFDVVTLLLNADLRLLRCTDARGSSPLQYVRAEHWPLWCRFFHAKKHLYWPDLGGQEDVGGTLLRVPPEPPVGLPVEPTVSVSG